MREIQVRSLGQEDALEKEMATHSVLLPGKFQGQRNLVGYSARGAKSRTQLSNFTFFCVICIKDHTSEYFIFG